MNALHSFEEEATMSNPITRARWFCAFIAAAGLIAATASCSTNTGIAQISRSGGGAITLEMSVGTIDDPSGTLGFAGTSLNVVASFRNGLGNSAYENPGQFSLAGPSGTVVAAQAGDGCDQLFSYGLFPGCVASANGAPFVGQPPAYNPPDSAGTGYATGIIVSGTAATAGNYTISTAVPVNGALQNYSANATLPSSPMVLPADAGVTGFTSDGNGGGTFTIAQPAGVTESVIVVTIPNPQGGAPLAAATLEASGTSATLPGDGSGCATAAPIPCGQFQVYVVGADYPLVEAGPPASKSPRPTLTGTNGTSDITVSGISTLTE
jgi:hypothetical protein